MEMVNELLEQVERLAQLMAQHSATRIDLSDGATQLILTRAPSAGTAAHTDEMPPLFLSGYEPGEPASEEPTESLWQPPALLEVRSELVGYCTLAPIDIGSTVARGQVLATVEVLGIPNEVVAPRPGVLEGWAVESGQPVQYGQAIAYLRPLSEE
ncbi:MAG: acetyl-CoA carboxylase biotin carboxyl carrier protein subunit [Fimbriimonadales bacterium]|nr:MAG: acetyl-CoA carboxylase biotin carboxyl carrier protein subunit [Fimbriimonadales bacterium]